jgi:hypothetical protein
MEEEEGKGTEERKMNRSKRGRRNTSRRGKMEHKHDRET